jgi:hypothetical protein
MSGSFSIDIRKFVAKAKDREDVVVRKICLEMFSRIVLRSPVDTGRFRGNWQMEIGEVPEGVLELDDKSGTATISKLTAQIAGVKAGTMVFFVNNLPYAIPLEYGHSKQAPVGMVRLTASEFGTVVENSADE